MALSHLVCVSVGLWVRFWMTLSHRRTQIRWAASDIRMCSSLVRPLILWLGVCFVLGDLRNGWHVGGIQLGAVQCVGLVVVLGYYSDGGAKLHFIHVDTMVG